MFNEQSRFENKFLTDYCNNKIQVKVIHIEQLIGNSLIIYRPFEFKGGYHSMEMWCYHLIWSKD